MKKSALLLNARPLPFGWRSFKTSFLTSSGQLKIIEVQIALILTLRHLPVKSFTSLDNLCPYRLHVSSFTLNSIAELIQTRRLQPLLHSDLAFWLLGYEKRQKDFLTILHDMSLSAIKKRKAEYLQAKAKASEKAEEPQVLGQFSPTYHTYYIS